jgi:F-type H+-transporting ATPase subunit delta
MRPDNQNSPLAKTYAEALLELAVGQTELPGGAEVIGVQLGAIRIIIREEPLVTPLLVDPAIGGDERHNLLDRVFKGRVADLLLNFLHVLADKDRLNLLYQICGAYQIMLDERVGKVEVDMTVAHRLDDAAAEHVRQRIGYALNRDVVLHQYVDEKILGGLILRVGDKLIDGSVQAQLEAMKEKFLAARPV